VFKKLRMHVRKTSGGNKSIDFCDSSKRRQEKKEKRTWNRWDKLKSNDKMVELKPNKPVIRLDVNG
jgi:hypothetical protein